MEQKIVRVPFNMGTAKRIQNKECAGKIITRVGGEVRNVVFDLKNEECPICAIVETDLQKEDVMLYLKDGSFRKGCEDDFDLMLEIPEIFKDGDIVRAYDNIVVVKNPMIDQDGELNFQQYASYNCNEGKLVNYNTYYVQRAVRFATSREKEIIKKAMLASGNPAYDDVLKKFFGVENIEECTLNPFDKVLVRDDDNDIWKGSLFSHIEHDKEYPYFCLGLEWKYCIPYNEKTAHLLGTRDNWEG